MKIQIQLGNMKAEAKKAYRDFFKKKLAERGISHPFENPDEIADFFAEVSEGWAKHKAENDIATKADK